MESQHRTRCRLGYLEAEGVGTFPTLGSTSRFTARNTAVVGCRCGALWRLFAGWHERPASDGCARFPPGCPFFTLRTIKQTPPMEPPSAIIEVQITEHGRNEFLYVRLEMLPVAGATLPFGTTLRDTLMGVGVSLGLRSGKGSLRFWSSVCSMLKVKRW
jgi:hypothetical protein